MGQPAARITDMHMCPMITPGTPPIPHVGGPIIGPGVPNVLIGKMPAVVMGDMCVCVGPPDTIVKGSTGVMIGGRPAARMGDLTVHGGSIVFGFPTVLIGEVGAPSAVNLSVTPVTVIVGPVVIPPIVFQNMPPESAAIADQTVTMQNAADAGTPFVEVCGGGNSPASDDTPDQEEPVEEVIEETEEDAPYLNACYFTDDEGKKTEHCKVGDIVWFIIESYKMVGEEVSIDLKDNGHNYKYNGELLVENILTVVLESEVHKVELEVVDEPGLKRIYFEDENEEVIETLIIDKNVYLVVESVNMIGKTIDINLPTDEIHYEYNGEPIDENTFKGFSISNDIDKVPLKIITKKETEPIFLESYFVDEDGNPIIDMVEGDTVTLVVVTQNMIGEKLEININDNEYDYKYNNNTLENDLLELDITEDEQNVQLTVVAKGSND